MVYLDNAATSCPKPPAVARAIAEALDAFGGVGRGVHAASIAAGLAVFEAREAVSALIGGSGADRVSFAANATAALNVAIAGLLPDGGVAVTTAASHNSVLRPLFKARDERGCSVRVAPHDGRGALDYGALERMADGADLIVLTHASNLTGDVYDAARAARIAHAAGARLVLDAAQTAGAVPFNMAEIGADVVCFTGHKGLLGPQGTGGLVLAAGVDIAPLLEGGSGTHSFDERHPRFMPEALEAGTLNAHGLAGLAAGIAYLRERGVDDVAAHETALASRFAERIAAVGGVRVLGGADVGRSPTSSPCADHGVRVLGGAGVGRCGIVAFTVGDVDSAFFADRLATGWGVCTRAGAHCAPLMHRALGTEGQGAVRVSFGPFNTEGDADTAAAAVAAIAREAEEGAR